MGKTRYFTKIEHPPYVWVGLFSIAFGFLEAIVVIYLRQLYYPEGFTFPLVMASPKIYIAELVRELTTLIMLIAIGRLVGKNFIQRFAWFLFAFGTWDIFFYIALKIFLDWPPSLLTWDILFLIPVVWNGPVLAPVLVSLTMIGSAVMVIEFEKRGFTVRLNRIEWILILAGAITVLYTFTEDYTGILIRNGLFAGVPLTEESPLVQQLLGYIPSHYNWFLFILGELMIVSAVFLIFSRVRHENA